MSVPKQRVAYERTFTNKGTYVVHDKLVETICTLFDFQIDTPRRRVTRLTSPTIWTVSRVTHFDQDTRAWTIRPSSGHQSANMSTTLVGGVLYN